ncbi:MAG: fatty acid desaturase family protein [Minisyncoccia bacterium]
MKKIQFNNNDGLAIELNKKINAYFEFYQISKKGDWSLYIKAIIMLALWLVPFSVPFFVPCTFIQIIGLAIISGIGMAGVGMNVMHDAHHGVFSDIPWLNTLAMWTMPLLSGNSFNWIHQHNKIHHFTTNINGHDDDVDTTKGIFRFIKEQPWKSHHKWQWLYAWPLYGLMTLMWSTKKDFRQMKDYFVRFNISKSRQEILWKNLIISKIIYFSIWVVAPTFLWSTTLDFGVGGTMAIIISFLSVCTFWVLMHYVGGMILTIIFQLAHVVPLAQTFPSGNRNVSWVRHQIETSVDFAKKNKLISWYIGGLNFQTEHHLFTNISHIHYPKISVIVEKFCKKHKIPFYKYKNFFAALYGHMSMLYSLGRKPALEN